MRYALILPVIRSLSILGILIVAAAVVAGAQPHATTRAGPDGKIYWTGGNVYQSNLDGSDVEHLASVNASNIAIDLSADMMYWTAIDTPKIQRASLDGTGVEDLVTGLGFPEGIALDVTRGKMYWTDKVTHSIHRANLDGSSEEDLIIRTGLPWGITLDVTSGKIYWTEASTGQSEQAGKIERANLDGSGSEVLVTGLELPYGIELDLTNSKMYWVDALTGKVQRANLNGSGVEDLVTEQDIPWDIMLDSLGGELYWTNLGTDVGAGAIQKAELDGTGVEDILVGLAWPQGIASTLPQAVQATATPPPVGGIAELPDAATSRVETSNSSTNVVIVAAIGAFAIVALGGTAWYARRRWLA